MDQPRSQSAQVAAARPAEPPLPWWRRAARRFGLQGKLILTFAALLGTALGSTCVVFFAQTEARMDDLVGDQAMELATALALSSEDGFRSAVHDELRLSASNLVRSRNIVFVGFYDPQGKALVERCRDPDFKAAEPGTRRPVTQNLLHSTRRQS